MTLNSINNGKNECRMTFMFEHPNYVVSSAGCVVSKTCTGNLFYTLIDSISHPCNQSDVDVPIIILEIFNVADLVSPFLLIF